MSVVRVANAGGFWGDDPEALRQQVSGGPIDFLTLDSLAEITMAILEKMRAKDPSAGWALDVIPALAAVLGDCLARGIRIVSNAGGVNPAGAAAALERLARKHGLSPRIAVVDGAMISAGGSYAAPRTPGEVGVGSATLVSAYAYLGARPIAEALARGADVVITGRVADASLTLGPLVAVHGWRWDDWDRLAAGTVAGHVLECGVQATGGNLTDWRPVRGLARAGYPIAEVDADGVAVITKHPDTGGAVTRASVLEQLLYEIGDPRAYATPDVTADFTSVRLQDLGGDRVRISGVRGVPPPPTLKTGFLVDAGWKAAGTYLFGPPDAREKAAAMAEIAWERLGRGFEETGTEIGSDSVRLAVRDRDRAAVERFSRRFVSLALSGPPGVTIPGGGRPPVQEVYAFHAGAIPRDAVRPTVSLGGETSEVPATVTESRPLPEPPPEAIAEPSGGSPARLLDLAFARSGDKGNAANIGVAARGEAAWARLRAGLTAERVRRALEDTGVTRVTRYELPDLMALNFVLEGALGGGGIVSLRSDPQGKLLAQRLLDLVLPL